MGLSKRLEVGLLLASFGIFSARADRDKVDGLWPATVRVTLL